MILPPFRLFVRPPNFSGLSNVRRRLARCSRPWKDAVDDSPDEILANKLNTLVGRAEERDLAFVMLLERAGYSVEDALPTALAKDGGCTPATLAWLLSQVEIPDGAALPASVDPKELREYVAELVRRLRRLAAPK